MPRQLGSSKKKKNSVDAKATQQFGKLIRVKYHKIVNTPLLWGGKPHTLAEHVFRIISSFSMGGYQEGIN
jgi:hypothetical protein